MEENLCSWLMSNLPELLTAISTFLGAVVVAAIVAVITYKQLYLEREKFKLDLFEKRFAVYSAAREFLRLIKRSAKIEMKDLSEYLGNTQDAAFLFDEKIADHLISLYKKAVDLQTTQKLYEHLPVGDERERLCNKEHDLLIELGNELLKLKDVFAPYLKFKAWK
jgi:hypothetical protein